MIVLGDRIKVTQEDSELFSKIGTVINILEEGETPNIYGIRFPGEKEVLFLSREEFELEKLDSAVLVCKDGSRIEVNNEDEQQLKEKYTNLTYSVGDIFTDEKNNFYWLILVERQTLPYIGIVLLNIKTGESVSSPIFVTNPKMISIKEFNRIKGKGQYNLFKQGLVKVEVIKEFK